MSPRCAATGSSHAPGCCTISKADLIKRAFRLFVCLGAVAIITFVAFKLIPVNATTAGFAYLLLVLAVASTWGFLEAAITSVAATLMFNRYFFEPIGTFTIS